MIIRRILANRGNSHETNDTDILKTAEQSTNEMEYILNLNSYNDKHTRIIPGNENMRKLMENSMKLYDADEYTSELYIRSNIICVCAYILDFWRARGELTAVQA